MLPTLAPFPGPSSAKGTLRRLAAARTLAGQCTSTRTRAHHTQEEALARVDLAHCGGGTCCRAFAGTAYPKPPPSPTTKVPPLLATRLVSPSRSPGLGCCGHRFLRSSQHGHNRRCGQRPLAFVVTPPIVARGPQVEVSQSSEDIPSLAFDHAMFPLPPRTRPLPRLLCCPTRRKLPKRDRHHLHRHLHHPHRHGHRHRHRWGRRLPHRGPFNRFPHSKTSLWPPSTTSSLPASCRSRTDTPFTAAAATPTATYRQNLR